MVPSALDGELASDDNSAVMNEAVEAVVGVLRAVSTLATGLALLAAMVRMLRDK